MLKTKLAVCCLATLLGSVGAAQAGKRVVIDKRSQTLRAYQDGVLVMKSRVSTGRAGKETPSGSFRARSKSRMHYSTLYENAPMPYSVQFSGNYFIHGYSSVPPFPASHGCIRMPVGSAAAFFNWVEPGTPITVTGQWSGRTPRRHPARRHGAATAFGFGRRAPVPRLAGY